MENDNQLLKIHETNINDHHVYVVKLGDDWYASCVTPSTDGLGGREMIGSAQRTKDFILRETGLIL